VTMLPSRVSNRQNMPADGATAASGCRLAVLLSVIGGKRSLSELNWLGLARLNEHQADMLFSLMPGTLSGNRLRPAGG
jgi:hypothetical protein